MPNPFRLPDEEPITARFLGNPNPGYFYYYDEEPENDEAMSGQHIHDAFMRIFYDQLGVIDMEEGEDGVWRMKK